jgi:GTP-binding protein
MRPRLANGFYKTVQAILTGTGTGGGRVSSSLATSPAPADIRNVAIIAHVDHGKTTLIDRLLSQAGTAVSNDRVMDSGEFEKERGITISAKYTSFTFEGTTFNVVDTPGHADFGAEVERALGLVDGALLVVDACEGPMSQTKYVLGKALARGLRPLVLLNKVDRPSATEDRCLETESKIFDVFDSLGATEEQLDFKTLYASARSGWAADSLPAATEVMPANHGNDRATSSPPTPFESAVILGMAPLLKALQSTVPSPEGDPSAPFTMLVSMTERDPFLGRIVTGRIAAGRVQLGDSIRLISHNTGAITDGFKVTKLFKRSGTGTIDLAMASVGDIVSVAGVGEASISDSIVSPDVAEGIAPGKIDPPTLSMVFAPNNSPLAGRDGMAVTTAKIGEWLSVEAESNISLRVRPLKVTNGDGGGTGGGGNSGESWEVQARGELQLGLIIGRLRLFRQ